ncbi:MAG: hypothetical protein JNM76_18180 [Betaproteobacteria bacterium]|nr:hypothetical protein [Betaproteobacteria bacterium]
MLRMTLHAPDLIRRPVRTASGWTFGRSVIEPFAHNALHAECIASAKRTLISVRERMRGESVNLERIGLVSERALDDHLRALRQRPLDFNYVEVVHEGDSAGVRLGCGRWGSAPIYLLARNGVLHAHWDIAALYEALPNAKLDPAFAAKYLVELDHPYSRRTIFPDIHMLTERSVARIGPTLERIAIRYPSAERHAEARRLKPGARVTAAFKDILQSAMHMRILSDEQIVALELSGGLDSTLVAASAASLRGPGVRSYGMIMPGPDGEWQRRRRDDTVRRFGLIDRSFPAATQPPFGPTSARVRTDGMIPFGEFYDEAVGHLMDLARADGVDTIFTGMGGDELCSLQWGEVDGGPEASDCDEMPDDSMDIDSNCRDDTREVADSHEPAAPTLTRYADDAYHEGVDDLDPAPEPLLYRSALESAAAVSALYLRKGIWPVSPLCTPELVEFCRRLPFLWREDRTVHRKVLASYGCPRLITRPTHLETFLGVMHKALSQDAAPRLRDLFAEPRLADQGLVDAARLRELYGQFRQGDRRYEDQILAAAMLELTVRSVESRIASRRPDAQRAARR